MTSLEQYLRQLRRRRLVCVALLLLVVLLAGLSLWAGSASLTLSEWLQATFTPDQSPASIIIWRLRIPRTIAAIVAGAALALSGCVMQTVLKNPLASPATMGISQAAVFGVNLAIIVLQAGSFHSTDGVLLTFSNPYLVTFAAFTFALIAMLSMVVLAGRRGFSSETMVLAGIAVGAAFSAGTTLLQFFALDTQLAAAVFWTFGDLGRATGMQNLLMALCTLPAVLYFFWKRWDYNALATGDSIAISLGVNTRLVRFASLLLASLLCAVSVTFLGIIGFVGLVAPHLVKPLVGHDHRFLISATALAGAALLLLADIIARTAMTGTALPVGAITSLFGAPLFLGLLLKGKRRRRP